MYPTYGFELLSCQVKFLDWIFHLLSRKIGESLLCFVPESYWAVPQCCVSENSEGALRRPVLALAHAHRLMRDHGLPAQNSAPLLFHSFPCTGTLAMHTAYSCTACMPCSVSQEHVQDLIASLPPLPERLREEEEEINKTSSCWFTLTLTFVIRIP